MKVWKHLRKLLEYLSPEPSLVSPRKHIAVIAALLAVAAIAGAVVLTPSRHPRSPGAAPDVWEMLHQQLSNRAQVDLVDDFSQGVDDWQSGENLASTWSYDKNGFVNPGSLSLFEPSMHLTNYDLEAVVQIESKGVGLAFRAASSHTYQAVNLLVAGFGRDAFARRGAICRDLGPPIPRGSHPLSRTISIRYVVSRAFGSSRERILAVCSRELDGLLVRCPANLGRGGPILFQG